MGYVRVVINGLVFVSGRTLNCLPASLSRNVSMIFAFSSFKGEQVEYKSAPAGNTYCEAVTIMRDCKFVVALMLSDVMRHRISGWRRSVPKPVQGASRKTTLNFWEDARAWAVAGVMALAMGMLGATLGV